MSKTYIVKENDGNLTYDDVVLLKNPSSIKIIDHAMRIKILKSLSRQAMYPAELAKELKIHEQKIYYHIKLLMNAGILEIVEKKAIRGTTAKKFRPKDLNFAVCLNPDWKNINELIKGSKDEKLHRFLSPFIQNNKLKAHIVVGSPDPHGPHKARARDGHYAIELAYFLGSLSKLSKTHSTKLDVNIDLKGEETNLIVFGGPVTNLVMAKINDFLPAKFSDKKPWGIIGKNTTYTDDNIGLIAKIPNPYHPNHRILVVAGITYNGTRAAVLALTKYNSILLSRYTEQKEFYAVIEGYDMDGDGRVDSIEIHE